VPFPFFFAIYIFSFLKFNKFQLKLKSNNLAGVRTQNYSSFASFGFEHRLVGLANVLQCGWDFLLLFCGGKKKTK
jgi:hypothetical protein